MLQNLRLQSMFDPRKIQPPIDGGIPQMPQLPQATGPMMPNGPVGPNGPAFPINMNNPPVVGPGIDLNQPVPTQDRLQQLYSPETAASGRLDALLAGYPEREKPGILKKIVAGLATLGPNGMKAQEEIMYGDHNRSVEDWKNRVNPAVNAAQLERQSNAASESAFNTRADNDRADKNLGRLREAATEKTRIDDAKLEISRKKGDLEKWKADNPNMVFKTDANGMIIGLHPRTGVPVETGVNSGDLSDVDKIRFGLDAALTRIGASGDQVIRAEGARQTNRLTNAEIADANTKENIALRGEEARTTKTTASTSATTSKGELPTQTKVRRYNNATSYLRQNPAAAKWIKADTNGEITVEAPGISKFMGTPTGPPPDVYQQIVDAIDLPGDASVRDAAVAVPPRKESVLSGVKKAGTTNTEKAPVKPKKGDKKTFPNGRKATHDGTNWIQDEVQ